MRTSRTETYMVGAGWKDRLSGPRARRELGAASRPFPVLKKTSVSLQAAEAIKALIVAGELTSGDALPPERDLAVTLG